MTEAAGSYKLIGISGSLRRESNCTAILRTLEGAPAAICRSYDFQPRRICRFSTRISMMKDRRMRSRHFALHSRGCDGLLVVTPEYNHGIPGVLKNAIDWASRPSLASPLVNLPVMTMTVAASPLGGARAQAQVNEAFLSCIARITPGRQVIIGGVEKKMASGRLVHEDTLKFALNAFEAMLDEICLVKRRPPRPGSDPRKLRNLGGRKE